MCIYIYYIYMSRIKNLNPKLVCLKINIFFFLETKTKKIHNI